MGEPGRAGIDTYLLYGVETTYATKASSINTHFGIVQSFTPNNRNALIETRGFQGTTTGGRDLIRALGGQVEVTLTLEFEPQHFDWLQYVLGARTGSGTSASKYEYTGSKTLPSLTISDNADLGDNDRALAYLGCKVNSMTLRSNFGEAVNISLDISASRHDKADSLVTPVALSAADVYTFDKSSIEWPAGTEVDNVIDSFELTLNNNVEMLYGLGSNVAQRAKEQQREHRVRVEMKTEDDTFVEAWLGGAAATSATGPTRIASVKFVLGGGANHNTEFTYSNLTLDDWADPKQYGDTVPENLSGIAETLVVTEQQTA